MLDKEFYHETLDKMTATWGAESDYRVCIEEMSELTKELCKFMRYSRNDKSEENDKKLDEIRKNIIEETADVLICANHMKRLFGEKEVEDVMDYKIQRGRQRVEKYIEEHK